MRDCEDRLMVVTRLVESHFIPSHLQNGDVSDQAEGGGVRDLRKVDMTAASSSAKSAVVMMVEKMERESRV